MTPVEHADDLKNHLNIPGVLYLEYEADAEGTRSLLTAWHRYIDVVLIEYEETLKTEEWYNDEDERTWNRELVSPLRCAWKENNVSALLNGVMGIQSLIEKRPTPLLASMRILNHVSDLCDVHQEVSVLLRWPALASYCQYVRVPTMRDACLANYNPPTHHLFIF